METVTFIDLFCGVGGIRIGMEQAGFHCVMSSDINEECRKTYYQNFSDMPLGDICKVEVEDIPKHSILCAGFPCQPFSNAGNRKGVNDKNGRGTLFEECERILKAKIEKGVKPKAFVFENVRGILSSKMDSGITVPEEIRIRMEALGYNVSMQLLRASDYGVPQSRYRVLIIGISAELGFFRS